MISNRYFPSIALKADKTSELYNFVSFVNLVKRILSSTHAAAFLLFSTKTAYCAPRLTASSPICPLPANRSKK